MKIKKQALIIIFSLCLVIVICGSASAESNVSVTSIDAPSSIGTGEEMNVNYTLTNSGNETAYYATEGTTFYLSSNDTWDETDIPLNIWEGYQVPIDPGACVSQSVNLVCPNVVEGDYFIIAGIDFTEKDLTNNDEFYGHPELRHGLYTTTLHVNNPDLTITNIDSPSTAVTQTGLFVNYTVENQGTSIANETGGHFYWTDILYLSTDDQLDGSDIYITEENSWLSLEPGSNYTSTIGRDQSIPNLTSGDYYVIVITNYNGYLYEPNRSNNLLAVPITILNPDLVVTDVVIPNVWQLEEYNHLIYTVSNQGNGEANPPSVWGLKWADTIFLSQDEILDESDTGLVGCTLSNPLAAGDNYTVNTSFALPSLPVGNYFLIIKTDDGNKVYESNENNNVIIKPFTIMPPAVSSVDPVNGAVNVDNSKVVTITFSTRIQSGNMWIELKNSSGTVIPITTSITDKVLTITSTTSLAESIYTLIIHTGAVTDLAGNPVVLTSSKFSVGTSPIVISTDPANNAVNVAQDKVISVTFSEPIKAGNLWIELYNGSTQIPITKTISGNVLTITHSALLAPGTKYTLGLHSGCVLDLAGNPLALVGRVFTTSADVTAPTVTSTDPVNNAVNVARDKVISVMFSEPIKAGNLWIELYNGSTQIPITMSINGSVLTIKHAALLAAGTKYTLCCHSGSITDLAGNPLALLGRVFNTSTDTAVPKVTSTDPINNAVNVARDKVIQVTFSEPIKAGNLWIELYNGSTQIPLNISISGNILTITHTTLLTANTKYTLSLHTGSILDLAGNPLALFTRVFTTGST